MTERRRVPFYWTVLGLVLLHGILSIRLVDTAGASHLRSLLVVQPDLLVLLVTGALLAARRGYRSWIGHVLVGGLIFVLLMQTAESIFAVVYGRAFVAHSDLSMADGLWVYLTDNRSTAAAWGIAIGAGLGLAVLWVVLYFGVRTVVTACSATGGLWTLLAVGQLAVIGVWIESGLLQQQRPQHYRPSMLVHAGQHVIQFLHDRPWRDAARLAARCERAEAERAESGTNLARLGGAHVGVMFLESYGRVLFREKSIAGELSDDFARWTRLLADRGFSACSSYATAPVVGADSHVAHTELLAGIQVENKAQVNLLLESDFKAMPRFFSEAGYRTINVQPKLLVEWPGSRLYGFTEDFFGRHTSYMQDGGVLYHWAHGPDQYYLKKLLDRAISKSDKSVFWQYVSVTSHAPFTKIPPYHEDWSTAGDATRYQPVHRYDMTILDYFHHRDAVPAFLATIRYSLQTVVGFARQLEHPTLLIVLGDHQPPLFADERRTYDVPIHVISNRPELLDPFRARGFVPGLVPPDEDRAAPFPMHRLLPWLLTDFSR